MNQFATDAASLEQGIQTLIEQFQELLSCLEQERLALRRRDLTSLHAASEAKARVCAVIEAALGRFGEPLPDLIAAFHGEESKRLDVLHGNLRELAREAQDSNAVNGKIIHRSQQSVRDLIAILGDTHRDVLYGEQGVFRSSPSWHGRAIAQA
jgi:flagellar biosynthesis/type III secretory pathway chaperone